MTLVRYTNKKTGWVSVYESKSHYDPVTKQSRPIRKYVGYEDPSTGELVRSSGKPGRKKKTGGNEAGTDSPAKKNESSRDAAEMERQREEIRELKKQVESLTKQLDDMHRAADRFMKEINRSS